MASRQVTPDLSPRTVRRRARRLQEFDGAYREYHELRASDDPQADRLRQAVTQAIPDAERAMNSVGLRVQMYPPPAIGGLVLDGLANVAFADERFLWGEEGPLLVQDGVESALGALTTLEEQLRRERRNPFYWGDRVLRALLGFPAYLLSLILGVPASKVEQSAFGPALRVAGLVVEGLVVFFGGREIGWW